MQIKIKNIAEFIQNHKIFFLIFIIIILFIPIYFLSPLKSDYPIGYAGLYAEASEIIRGANFRLPMQIPFYGGSENSIPFTYPPLSFYLMAFITKLFQISDLTYLKIFPSIFLSAAVVPFFLFSLELLGNKRVTALASFILLASISYTNEQLTAAGITRALAFFTMLFALWFVLRVFKYQKWYDSLFGCLFIGITGLIHPGYAEFLLLSIFVFLFFPDTKEIKKKIVSLFILGLGSILFILPWVYIMLTRYGFTPFFHAFGSTTLSLGKLTSMVGFVNYWYFALGINDSRLIGIVFIVSLVISILQRKRIALFVWWFLAVIIFGSNMGSRFGIIPLSLMVSGCFEDVNNNLLIFLNKVIGFISSHNLHESTIKIIFKASKICCSFAIIILLCYMYYVQWGYVSTQKSVLDAQYIEMASWVKQNTLPKSRLLLVTQDVYLYDWTPYFFKRSLVINPYGAEWTGSYQNQINLSGELEFCLNQQSITCFQDFLINSSITYDYLLTTNEGKLSFALNKNGYENIHQVGKYTIWKKET